MSTIASMPPFARCRALTPALPLLALVACSDLGADEPEPMVEEVTVFADDSPEGACLTAVADRAGGATLAIESSTTGQVIVAADGTLWRCHIGPDGTVVEVAPPAGRPQ
jgi:hypothetical protein